jgi:hypothetical protein
LYGDLVLVGDFTGETYEEGGNNTVGDLCSKGDAADTAAGAWCDFIGEANI